jgi:HK97 family phage major capsid protein
MTRFATHRGNPPNNVKTGVPEVDNLVESMFPTPIPGGLSQALAAGAAGWQTYRDLFGTDMPHHSSKRPYSLSKAIQDVTEHGGVRGLEKECSRELASRLNRQPHSFFVPFDVPLSPSLNRRTLTETTGAGAIPGKMIPSGLFIDVLRSKLLVAKLGAQIRNFAAGERGRIQVPIKSSAANVSWVSDGIAPPAQSNMVVGGSPLTPHTISNFTDTSRRMLKLGTPDFLARIEEDVVTSVAIGIDAAALNGAGNGGVPLGVFQNTGLPYANFTANSGNGGAPAFADLCNMESIVGQANGDASADARMGFATSPQGRSKLRRTPDISGIGTLPAWCVESGIETLLGWPALSSTSVPANLTQGSGTSLTSLAFGNWADLLVNLFSAPDVLVDPFTSSSSGGVRITVFQDVDVLVARSGSFCLATGMITS